MTTESPILTKRSSDAVDDRKHHRTGKSNSSSSALAQAKVGAFNGSGVAVAGESFDSGGHGETILYFQHYTGQIRSTQLQPDGTWQGGSPSEVVATDAKDASPISAVSYSVNGTNTVRHYVSILETITYIFVVALILHRIE